MTVITKLNEKFLNFEQQKEVLIKELKKDLKATLQEIFEIIPSIQSICWTQYTPYFNDGEACEFSLSEIIVSNSKEAIANYPGANLGDDNLWADSAYSVNKKYITEESHRKLLKDFASIIFTSECLIQEVFGDHVKVIATKDGLKTEPYEHD